MDKMRIKSKHCRRIAQIHSARNSNRRTLCVWYVCMFIRRVNENGDENEKIKHNNIVLAIVWYVFYLLSTTGIHMVTKINICFSVSSIHPWFDCCQMSVEIAHDASVEPLQAKPDAIRDTPLCCSLFSFIPRTSLTDNKTILSLFLCPNKKKRVQQKLSFSISLYLSFSIIKEY